MTTIAEIAAVPVGRDEARRAAQEELSKGIYHQNEPGPIDRAINAGQDSNTYLPRMFPPVFSARGLVSVGYAAFAFALGVAIGLVVRRTLVALAVTLAVVILVQIVTPSLIRPHLMAPTEQYIVATSENVRGFMLSGPDKNAQVKQLEVASGSVGAWKLSDQTVDKNGTVQKTLPSWTIKCAPAPPGSRYPKAAIRN